MLVGVLVCRSSRTSRTPWWAPKWSVRGLCDREPAGHLRGFDEIEARAHAQPLQVVARLAWLDETAPPDRLRQ